MTKPHPMLGRVAMVTGANGDMGRVIATNLAHQGASVALVVRHADQGEALQREIRLATGNEEINYLVTDLSDPNSIRQMVTDFHRHYTHLHILINNAGLHLHDRRLSVNGLEMHFAVNHLGWFLLTNLLLDTLKASAPARIVNVSSQAMADTRQIGFIGEPKPVTLDLNDLQSERDFKPMVAYARSKLAMVMCGYALARRLSASGVTVNALHPGLVATAIVADVAPRLARPFLKLIKPFLLTAEQGARTAIYLASAPEVEGVTGKYFIQGVEQRSPEVSYDLGIQEQLWCASAALVNLH